MLPHHFARRHSTARRPHMLSTSHVGSRHLFRQVLFTLFLCLLLFTTIFGDWAFPLPYAFAAGGPHPIPGHLTLQQFQRQGRPDHVYHGSFIPPGTSRPLPGLAKEHATTIDFAHLPLSSEIPTMKPISLTLDPAFLSGATTSKPLDLLGSDQRLEVQISPGAFDLSHATTATGTPTTPTPTATHAISIVTPIPTATHPASSPTPTATHTMSTVTPTPTATHVSGTATPTLTPTLTPAPTGTPVTGPLTLSLTQVHGHFPGQVNLLGRYTFQLTDSQGRPLSGVLLHSPITYLYHYTQTELTSLSLDPSALVLTWPDLIAIARKAHQPTSAFTVLLHNDPTTHTLSGQSRLIGPFDMGGGNPDNQSPPTSHFASVQGNSGQLSYGYPLAVAPGPPGLVPSLVLGYSSQGSNDRHNPTSPAGSVGDGWSLSLGSITADEYPSGSAGVGTWYFLSGVANVSDRLVPNPNPPDPSNPDYLTEHISQLKIQKSGSGDTACFHVWDTASTYYTFGCSSDSLQYDTDSNGVRHNYRWDLNFVANGPVPHGQLKTINISYLQDIITPGGHTTVRDAVIKQITYGGASTAGTVDFSYRAPFTNAPWATAYGTNYNCASTPPTSTTLRCDDPLAHPTGPGQNAPLVMSTFTLQTVTSYVGDDSSASHKDYSYNLSYLPDTPFSQCWDDYTQVQRYCAGNHLLSGVTPTVYQNGASHQLKGLSLTYSVPYGDDYYDTTHTILNGTQQIHNSTFLNYLIGYYDGDTGIGAKIGYSAAYNNTHGTPEIDDGHGTILDNRLDPLYCSKHSDCTGSFAWPQDRAWSAQVVTQITSSGRDSSTSAAATTTYAYALAVTASPGNCPADRLGNTNCVGDNWLPGSASNKHDTDFLDYYHSEYRGFTTVYTTSPAGDLTAQSYASTEGWFSLEGHSGNYTAGNPYEEDVYRGNSTSGPLLRQTVNTYGGNGGTANSCNGNYSDLYTPCEVMLTKIRTTFPDGTGNANPPWVEHDYTYDNYNSTGLIAGYHNLLFDAITSANAPALTREMTYTTNDQTVGGWTFHNVHTLAHSDLLDPATGKKWQCQDITYDEGLAQGTPAPVNSLPTTLKTYSDCANQASTTLTSYAGYDLYGNPVAGVDGLGTANSSFYGSGGTPNFNGCTLTTNPVVMSGNWGKTNYTSCTVYDGTSALPTSISNALSQQSSIAYDATQGDLPTSATDVNSQQTSTSYSYDTSGNRTVQVSQPLETNGYTHQSSTNSTCPTGMPASYSLNPCFEIASNSSLYNTAITHTFYDSLGRVTETRTPAPGGSQDFIVFTVYNDSTHTTFQSVPFQAPHTQNNGSWWLDPATAIDPSTNHPPTGTGAFYDALGRAIAMQDPLFGATGVPGIPCSTTLSGNYTACTNYGLGSASGDSTLFASTTSIDPNNHVAQSFADALGRVRYVEVDRGLYGASPTVNQQKSLQYNLLGEPTQITVTDKAPQPNQVVTTATTTALYDSLGRPTSLSDPDRGAHTFTYDPDGRVLSDVSGSRTLGYNFDLLGRTGCVQNAAPTINATGACTNGANPLIQNTYDVTKIGSQGVSDFPVGRLTKSIATTYFPEGGSATTIQKMQYDQRGRPITGNIVVNLPSSWNVTTALPTYKLALTYNDANQGVTATTSMISPNGTGYTTTRAYDTTGALVGLSNNSNPTPNLATLSYNGNGLLGAINFQTTSGTSLANEQFGYDGDLRATSATATWLSGSGTSGAIFSQSRSYDPASNVTSLTTTHAVIQGQSLSGGTETQNFCYDEENRLVWAGNSGTQPGAGNGTCGSGALGNTLNGAAYQSAFAYTNLGQLWKGPVAGTGSSQQYLYCDNTHPHQLTGIYPSGATCPNPSGALYTSSYDAFGNVTSRTTGGATSTLSYDALDHLVEWKNSSGTAQEWYLYDASGQRVLRRSTSGGVTTITTYPYGIEEHAYDGTGVNQGNTYYYSLGGLLIGELTSSPTSTNFFITDGLGSVLATFSSIANSAALLGNQVYSPYGTQRYTKGSMGTAKGFTGQYNDSVSGLDYYNARYYDPVASVFLSADVAQGNSSGRNPYDYVGGNPETWSDPTGQRVACPDPNGCGGGGSGGPVGGGGGSVGGSTGGGARGGGTGGSTLGDIVTLEREVEQAVQEIFNPETDPFLIPVAEATAPVWGPLVLIAIVDSLPFILMGAILSVLLSGDAPIPTDTVKSWKTTLPGQGLAGGGSSTATDAGGGGAPLTQTGGRGAIPPGGGPPPATGGAFCSFTPDTQVTTDHGKQSMSTLRVGEKVQSYNPKTHKMEVQPILHVWTHTDRDLVDLTITTTTKSQHGKSTTLKGEVVHTTSEHPFLTTENGFVPAGKARAGMHVLRADGSVGVITGWRSVHGTRVMYNLEVAHDHTFTVGNGQWVVHNSCDPDKLRRRLNAQGRTVQNTQAPHHIIPCALENHPLIGATNGGFDINEAYNGRPLWSYKNKPAAFGDMEPYHANSPRYMRRVGGMMDDAYQKLQNSGTLTSDTAFNSLMGIIDSLNTSIDVIGWFGALQGEACPLY